MAAQCVKRLALGLMLVVATFLTSCDGQGASGTETIVINGKSFVLEVASDLPAIEAGLSNRATIPDGTGMLFILPSSRKLKFWMKNCLTDIDIIYLDPNGRVTATHRMKAETPQGANETEKQYELRLTNYPSRFPAQFAIELPSGSLDQLNVRFEDKIELDLERLKALAH